LSENSMTPSLDWRLVDQEPKPKSFWWDKDNYDVCQDCIAKRNDAQRFVLLTFPHERDGKYYSLSDMQFHFTCDDCKRLFVDC